MDKYHTHDGIDNYRLNPKDFLGFPVIDYVPDYKSEEGTPIYVNIGGIKYLYVFIAKQWNQVARFSTDLSTTSTLDFGNILPNTSADLTVTLTGAIDTDTVSLGVQGSVISGGTNCNNIIFFAFVSSANTVTVRCLNNSTVNTANPASGTFRITTTRY